MKGRVSNELSTSPPASAETNSRAFGSPIDLSIIIPALNEGPNLMLLLPQLRAEVKSLEVSSEILIVTREIDPETATAGTGIRGCPGYGFPCRSRGILADHGRRSLA